MRNYAGSERSLQRLVSPFRGPQIIMLPPMAVDKPQKEVPSAQLVLLLLVVVVM